MAQSPHIMHRPTHGFKGCSQGKWRRTAAEEAEKDGVDLIQVLSGCRVTKFVAVRWRAFQILAAQGCSYSAIGKASGFDHTSVRYGCDPIARKKGLLRHKPKKSPAMARMGVERAWLGAAE